MYYLYDSLGRISDQYSNVGDGFNPIAGIRSYKDSYTYDTIVIGQLTSVTRASNLESNSCGSNCFEAHYQKDIDYDDQNRAIAETSTLTNALNTSESQPDANYTTKFYYDDYYNRLIQVIYADSYSVENIYTQYGALTQQVDALTGTILMEVNDWNYKGQELSRVFNISQTGGSSNMGSDTSYYPSTGQIKQILNTSANKQNRTGASYYLNFLLS